MPADALTLVGKDFLTEDEAAVYCCVSKSTFCANARSLGLQARRWMGRKVYSKADLYEAMSRAEAWQRSTGGPAASATSQAPTPISTGGRTGSSGGAVLARLSQQPLRRFARRKKPS